MSPLMGAYLEAVSDLLGSVGVLVAGAIMWATGCGYADPIFSAIIGLFILPRNVEAHDASGGRAARSNPGPHQRGRGGKGDARRQGRGVGS
ncbi:MAG: cation transporter [Gemmataceae bacterium]|nr:cation transporter [Gemmataceae bacterium]